MSKNAHAKHVERTYGLTGEEYDDLYQLQGGECALRCGARGLSKRLATDHDHECAASHGGEVRRCCVRGLLCTDCNRHVIKNRTPEFFQRAMWYLMNPPAKRLT